MKYNKIVNAAFANAEYSLTEIYIIIRKIQFVGYLLSCLFVLALTQLYGACTTLRNFILFKNMQQFSQFHIMH